jgi:hypothetical protein
MSLLNTASPWNTDGGTRKRIASIGKRRTQKATTLVDEEPAEEAEDSDISGNFEDTMNINAERESTVTKLLNKITASSTNAGNGLEDFKPLSENLANRSRTEGFESPMLKKAAAPNASMPVPSDFKTDSMSSYNKSYESGGILGKPYYTSMGIAKSGGSSGGSSDDGALFQKLNYMTHILEDIQMEKTSNVTEELILYSFLGVFVIFIVDSFTRAGKYYR